MSGNNHNQPTAKPINFNSSDALLKNISLPSPNDHTKYFPAFWVRNMKWRVFDFHTNFFNLEGISYWVHTVATNVTIRWNKANVTFHVISLCSAVMLIRVSRLNFVRLLLLMILPPKKNQGIKEKLDILTFDSGFSGWRTCLERTSGITRSWTAIKTDQRCVQAIVQFWVERCLYTIELHK